MLLRGPAQWASAQLNRRVRVALLSTLPGTRPTLEGCQAADIPLSRSLLREAYALPPAAVADTLPAAPPAAPGPLHEAALSEPGSPLAARDDISLCSFGSSGDEPIGPVTAELAREVPRPPPARRAAQTPWDLLWRDAAPPEWETHVGLLKLLMCGGAWSPHSLFCAGLLSEDACPLCSAPGADTAHFLYVCSGCPHVRDPAIAQAVGDGSCLPACLRHFAIAPELGAVLEDTFWARLGGNGQSFQYP